MRLSALRWTSVAALMMAAPLATAFAAQSSASVPSLPPSNWKPDRPVEFVVQAAADSVDEQVAQQQPGEQRVG